MLSFLKSYVLMHERLRSVFVCRSKNVRIISTFTYRIVTKLLI